MSDQIHELDELGLKVAFDWAMNIDFIVQTTPVMSGKSAARAWWTAELVTSLMKDGSEWEEPAIAAAEDLVFRL
eukprot:2437491-Pleurochrysis_carterae.AAC.2